MPWMVKTGSATLWLGEQKLARLVGRWVGGWVGGWCVEGWVVVVHHVSSRGASGAPRRRPCPTTASPGGKVLGLV